MAYFSKTISILGLLLFLTLVSEARVSKHKDNLGFVKTRGSHFYLNGRLFLLNGFNSYWMMNVATDVSERHKVSQVFQQASAAGLSVCRTWAFADGGNKALQLSPGTYDERVFQGLDFVVAEARRFNIRLILSFVNNYNDFGGKAQYVQWARNAGVQINNDDDFYTHPVIKGYYKNHMQKVITRFNTITGKLYKDDSTIMAWELMNEPRCQVDYSGKTINGWVQEMASFVKSLDSKHLLEIGMEGFYGDTMPDRKPINPGYQVGTDFISNNLIKEIDFATIHAYPDIWLSKESEDAQLAFMGRWISNHYMDAARILKKPLIIAEFGMSNKDPGFSLNARDLYMGAVYRSIYKYAQNGGTLAGALVWQLMAQGMQPFYDGYEIVLAENPSTNLVISQQSHAMSTLSHLSSTTSQKDHRSFDQGQREISHGHNIDHGKEHGKERRYSP